MIVSSDTRKVQWIVKTSDSGANWTVYTAGGSDPFPVDSNGNVLGAWVMEWMVTFNEHGGSWEEHVHA